MTREKRKLPFTVSRHGDKPLSDQVADGLRAAIVQGRYRPGDEIPSSREMVPLLGVSRIVTRAALSRLAYEGYIHARPGMRSVVLDRGQRRWRGHVLFAYPWGDDNYDQTIIAATLRDALAVEGYLTTPIGVNGNETEPCDFTFLDAALAGPVDLVATYRWCPALFDHLAKAGIPFTTMYGGDPAPGAVGHTRIDSSQAVDDFAAACAASGARRVVAVSWCESPFDLRRPLAEAGISFSHIRLQVDVSAGRLLAVEHAGRLFFDRLATEGKLSRDTIYFTTDDYLARGGLMALACAGLTAPRDFRFASLSNAGLGPDYPRELSRIEYESAAMGRELAGGIAGLLKNGAYPSASSCKPVWIPGATMAGQ